MEAIAGGIVIIMIIYRVAPKK